MRMRERATIPPGEIVMGVLTAEETASGDEKAVGEPLPEAAVGEALALAVGLGVGAEVELVVGVAVGVEEEERLLPSEEVGVVDSVGEGDPLWVGDREGDCEGVAVGEGVSEGLFPREGVEVWESEETGEVEGEIAPPPTGSTLILPFTVPKFAEFAIHWPVRGTSAYFSSKVPEQPQGGPCE